MKEDVTGIGELCNLLTKRSLLSLLIGATLLFGCENIRPTTYTVVFRIDTHSGEAVVSEEALMKTKEALENRLRSSGLRSWRFWKDWRLTILRPNKITIEFLWPMEEIDEERLILLTSRGELDFRLVPDNPELTQKAKAGEISEGYELMFLEGEELLIQKKPVLTGEFITRASVSFDAVDFNRPYLAVELNDEGRIEFSTITGQNVGKRLAIVLDGKIMSAPVIQERIPSGQFQITGKFSVNEAHDLAVILKSGMIPRTLLIEDKYDRERQIQR